MRRFGRGLFGYIVGFGAWGLPVSLVESFMLTANEPARLNPVSSMYIAALYWWIAYLPGFVAVRLSGASENHRRRVVVYLLCISVGFVVLQAASGWSFPLWAWVGGVPIASFAAAHYDADPAPNVVRIRDMYGQQSEPREQDH